MWRQGCRRSNVWIARVQADSGLYALRDLQVVQDLPGTGTPFERLVALLMDDCYDAAAIDAPFSLPATYVPGGYTALLDAVANRPHDGRPFPKAAELLAAVDPPLLPRGRKVYRETERMWIDRGVNTRSTVWAGARGGAAMTVACLRLLHESNCPVWPWMGNAHQGCLVEAFPAAQLQAWGLPHQKYNGRDAVQQANRETIISGIEKRIDVGPFREQLMINADALDAVIAAFAGIAVTQDLLAAEPGSKSQLEGWIAVHR